MPPVRTLSRTPTQAPDPATGAVAPGAAAAIGTGIGAAGTAVIVRAGAGADADAIRKAILGLLGTTLAVLEARLRGQLEDVLRVRFPEEEIQPIMAEEARRAGVFRERSEERVREGLRRAMALPNRDEEVMRLQREVDRLEKRPTPDADKIRDAQWALDRARRIDGPRERAVRAVLNAEQRYTAQHASAVMARGVAAGERLNLKRISPTGAFWKLDPFVREHTAGCLIMGDKFWPWIILDRVHPPRHSACPCRLISYAQALTDGLLTPDRVPDDRTAVRLAAGVMMESDAEALLVLLRLEELGDPAAQLVLRG